MYYRVSGVLRDAQGVVVVELTCVFQGNFQNAPNGSDTGGHFRFEINPIGIELLPDATTRDARYAMKPLYKTRPVSVQDRPIKRYIAQLRDISPSPKGRLTPDFLRPGKVGNFTLFHGSSEKGCIVDGNKYLSLRPIPQQYFPVPLENRRREEMVGDGAKQMKSPSSSS